MHFWLRNWNLFVIIYLSIIELKITEDKTTITTTTANSNNVCWISNHDITFAEVYIRSPFFFFFYPKAWINYRYVLPFIGRPKCEIIVISRLEHAIMVNSNWLRGDSPWGTVTLPFSKNFISYLQLQYGVLHCETTRPWASVWAR